MNLQLRLYYCIFGFLFSSLLWAGPVENGLKTLITFDPAVAVLKGSKGVQISQTLMHPGWFYGTEWQGFGFSATSDKVSKSNSSVDEFDLYLATKVDNSLRPLLGSFPVYVLLKTGMGYLRKRERNVSQFALTFFLSPELRVKFPSIGFFDPEIFGSYSVSLGQASFTRAILGASLSFRW